MKYLILETADEKRLRLAKKMLSKLKEARETKDEDEFFATDGVYRDENEQDFVTKALQNDYVFSFLCNRLTEK